jgi:hypothetical protein
MGGFNREIRVGSWSWDRDRPAPCDLRSQNYALNPKLTANNC